MGEKVRHSVQKSDAGLGQGEAGNRGKLHIYRVSTLGLDLVTEQILGSKV